MACNENRQHRGSESDFDRLQNAPGGTGDIWQMSTSPDQGFVPLVLCETLGKLIAKADLGKQIEVEQLRLVVLLLQLTYRVPFTGKYLRKAKSITTDEFDAAFKIAMEWGHIAWTEAGGSSAGTASHLWPILALMGG